MDDNRCRGCGKLCITIYCDKCAKNAKCPHGVKIEDCTPCYVEGDLAFDSNRERGR